ncbi:MAG: ABC transporter ATP-binding protein [Desulfobacteraceae bacterium]|nr:MAG: ABC transporter ATP-binding protein [Desulfobacteraceae bacterium]
MHSTQLPLQTVLQASDLTHVYESAAPTPALNKVNLTVQSGEIFGLLGPNGAGKTTAISVMSTLLRPNAGQVHICGLDALRRPRQVRPYIGVVPQRIALFETLSASENLAYFGRLYGLRGSALKEALRATLAATGLEDRADQAVRTFSGGMKRRVNLAAGILHRPRLLFLDEPTVGIDAQSRNQILESLLRLKEQGIAIIYTTHYMEEVQRICSRLAIIDQGRILVQDNTQTLLEQHADCADLGEVYLKLTGRQLRD